MAKPIVECQHVTKSYGEIVAVNDVTLGIQEGEIFELVRPNGAGKMTLIEIMEGLRPPDGGSIRVLGLDPAKEADTLRERIGVQLQTTSIQPKSQRNYPTVCQSVPAAPPPF
jgi:ABC-2 type transport system ATP-binding protein